LTLRKNQDFRFSNGFLLDYPNHKIYESISRSWICDILGSESNLFHLGDKFKETLLARKPEEVVNIFNQIFSFIPFDDYLSSYDKKVSFFDTEQEFNEFLYLSTILSFLIGIGIRPVERVHYPFYLTDMVIEYGNQFWVIGYGFSRTDEKDCHNFEKAYRLIKEKGFSNKYLNPLLFWISYQ
jgi:hypothetical protein